MIAQAIEEKVSKVPLLKRILSQNCQEAIQYAGVIATVLAAFITLKGSEESINIQNKTEFNNYINQVIIQNYSCDK